MVTMENKKKVLDIEYLLKNKDAISPFLNIEYIRKHRLSKRKLDTAGIELLDGEIFVKIPKWRKYYISTHGRILSNKWGELRELKQFIDGGNKRSYANVTLSKRTRSECRKKLYGIHKLVAITFYRDIWSALLEPGEELDDFKIQVHHLDGNRINNYYKNLLPIPTAVHHNYLDKFSALGVIPSGKKNLIKGLHPYEAMALTGLGIEHITLMAGHKWVEESNLCKVLGFRNGYVLVEARWNGKCVVGYKLRNKKSIKGFLGLLEKEEKEKDSIV